MNDSDTAIGEYSLMLWLLAAAVAMLATHVFLGWVRAAQGQPTLRGSWVALLAAAFTFGTGLCAAVVLSISASALSFSPGYRLVAVPALWLGAMAAALLPAWWLMLRQNRPAIVGCGVLLGGTAILVQAGWLTAAGFRPGLVWHPTNAGGAALFLVLGMATALWMAFGGGGDASRQRPRWRIGAGVLMGLVLVAGQELLTLGTGLLAQVGSVFKDEVPTAVLCLAGGVLAPLVMAVMALDLELRRGLERRGGSDLNPAVPRRRRRKQRMRTL